MRRRRRPPTRAPAYPRRLIEQLIKLPKEMGACTKLEILNVGGNKLKTLPPTDGWTAMKEIKCHQNGLFMVPSFAMMAELEIIKMDFNKALENLPELGEHSKLEQFEVGNCNLTALPPSMTTVSARARSGERIVVVRRRERRPPPARVSRARWRSIGPRTSPVLRRDVQNAPSPESRVVFLFFTRERVDCGAVLARQSFRPIRSSSFPPHRRRW